MISQIRKEFMKKLMKGIYGWAKGAGIMAGVIGLAGALCGAEEGPVDLEGMVAKAESEGKWVFLEFFTYDGIDSKMLRNNVLTKDPVKGFLDEKFVPVRVRGTMNKELAARLRIKRYPTLVMLDDKGREVDRMEGYVSAQALMRILQTVTAGSSELVLLEKEAGQAGAGCEAHLKLAEAYRKRGDFEKALKEYVWILDQGAVEDRANFVRMKFGAVFGLGGLAKEYGEAEKELKGRRDRLAEAVKSGTGDARELISYNVALQNRDRNVELFLELPNGQTKKTVFFQLFLDLVEARKYREIAAFVNVESWVGTSYPQFVEVCSQEGADHKGHKHGMQEQRMREWSVAGVEVLLGVEDLNGAKRVAWRALDSSDERSVKELRFMLKQAAQRAKGEKTKEFLEWLEGNGVRK